MLLESDYKSFDDEKLLEFNQDLINITNRNKMGFLLNEAYYGKNPLLLEIEKNAEIIRQRVLDDPYYNPNFTTESKKICDLFAKLFNFEGLYLDWNLTNTMVNSMTMPISYLFFSKYSEYDVIDGKYGVQFKDPKGKHLIIITFTSLFSIAEMTAAEWVSIILHEIGHNFYNSKFTYTVSKLIILDELFSILINFLILVGEPEKLNLLITQLIVTIKATSKTSRKSDYNMQEILTKDKTFKPLLNKFNSIVFKITDIILNLVKLPLEVLSFTKIPLLISKIGIFILMGLRTIFFKKYQGEKFSDNFATIFGYGDELASVTLKFSLSKNSGKIAKTVNQIPVINEIYNTQEFIFKSIFGIADCHPREYTRVRDQAKLLQNEIKNNKSLTPAMKKEIEENLKNIEKIYSQLDDWDYLKENHETFKALIHQIYKSIFNKNLKDVNEYKDIIAPSDYELTELKPQSQR